MPNNLTVLPNKASTSATTVLRDKLTSLRIPLIPSTPPKMASFALAFPSKKEDESGLSSYYNNKTTIIQEARVFNESPVSPRKCRQLLTRIVYLLYAGETFSTQEATTLFFGTTKLFQHKDVSIVAGGLLRCAELCVHPECTPADGIPSDQGACWYRGGRDHGDE